MNREEFSRREVIGLVHSRGVELPVWCYLKPTRVSFHQDNVNIVYFSHPIRNTIEVDMNDKTYSHTGVK